MRARTVFSVVPGALLALCTFAAPAFVAADDADPPSRAARVSDVEGSVSLQPAGVQDWTVATINRPLSTGDRLWSDAGSRAELDAGDVVVRLGAGTAFAWLNLSDAVAQMQLTSGTLIVRVRAIQPDQIYEIDTPNLAVSLQGPGAYRVEVAPSGDATVVKVEDGAALVAGGGQTVSIAAQQQVTFNGSNSLSDDVASLAAPDELDGWSASRDQQSEDSASSEYVANNVPGTQDLDNSGTWQQTPEYGYVWVPTAIVAGWAPYRFGHWVWVSPWGWTWVDAANWGYAPFHYGRWVQCSSGSWCWVPGPRSVRAVYSPALVAWVGAPGGGAAPGAFNGSVGWFPLGPHEVYVPAYRASGAYVRRVNITNTTIVNSTTITNIYQNNLPAEHYANNRAAAVTAVSQAWFVSGQGIGANAMRVSAPVLAAAVVTASAPAIVPTVQSVLTPAGPRRIARPPPALALRGVVAHALPPASPLPFTTVAAAVAANGGHPPDAAALARLSSAPSAQVRLIAIAGPVVAAGSLAHHAGTGRAEGRNQVPAAAPGGEVSFAERERILEHPMSLPPPVHAPDSARANAFVPPAFAAETPPLPTYAPPARHAEVHQSAPANVAPAAGSSAPLPVFHPPGYSDPPAPDTRPAAPADHPPAPRAPPAAPASKPARDPAAHADRDSRERIVR
jgi:hypothetical protein